MRQIFVNLPVRDLSRSKQFFSGLGFGFEPKFTDEKAACMVVADNIFVMLLKEDFFSTFTKKTIVDAKKNTEVLLCLSCDSKEEVDTYVARAEKHGGRAAREAKDHGFMYEHAFEDPDGHLWELVHMRGDPQ
jgi:predicted lactoylglutathione lyase